MSWPTVFLDDIKAQKKYALNGGPFGSKLVSSDYTPEGVPVIRGVNLAGDEVFSFENFVFEAISKLISAAKIAGSSSIGRRRLAGKRDTFSDPVPGSDPSGGHC